MPKLKDKFTTLRRGMKDRDYTEEEVLVRQATSNSEELASAELLQKISQVMLHPAQYIRGFDMLWRRLSHLEYKRHVFKALLLLDHLMIRQPPSPEVQLALVVDVRDRWADVKKLAQLRVSGTSNNLTVVFQVASSICKYVEEYEQREGFARNKQILMARRAEQHHHMPVSDYYRPRTLSYGEGSPGGVGGGGGMQAGGSALWTCTTCTFENAGQRTTCMMCETQRPPPEVLSEQADKKKKKKDKWWWACAYCSFVNSKKGYKDMCEMCENKRTGKLIIDGQKEEKSAPSSLPAASHPPPTPAVPAVPAPTPNWNCSYCSYSNLATADTCSVCAKPKQAAAAHQRVWSCEYCSFDNKGDAAVCEVCQHSRAESERKVAQEQQAALQRQEAEDRIRAEQAAAAARLAQLQAQQDAIRREQELAEHQASERRKSIVRAQQTKREQEEERQKAVLLAQQRQQREQQEQAARHREEQERAQAKARAKIVAAQREAEEEQKRRALEQQRRQSMWECAWCSFSNEGDATVCDVCQRKKADAAGADNGAAVVSIGGATVSVPAGFWCCAWCKALSPHTSATCHSCGKDKAASHNSHLTKLQYATQKANTDSWQCPGCTMVNSSTATTCSTCSANKPVQQQQQQQQQQQPADNGGQNWTCQRCTFSNSGVSVCAVCGHQQTPPPQQKTSLPLPFSHTSISPTRPSHPPPSYEDLLHQPQQPQQNLPAQEVSPWPEPPAETGSGQSLSSLLSPSGPAEHKEDKEGEGQQSSTWSCSNCAAVNDIGDSECDLCGVPRAQGHSGIGAGSMEIPPDPFAGEGQMADLSLHDTSHTPAL